MGDANSLNILVSDRDALLAVTMPSIGWAHSAQDVAEVAEAMLERMAMPKGMRKGITATHVSKEPDARIYSGTVIGSTVTLRRAADGWRVIGFVSAWVSGQQRGKLQLRISPAQDAAAAKAIRATCGIVLTRAVAETAHGAL